MTRTAVVFTRLTAVLVCLLPAAPAQAQAARSFVSATGSDSNNCINVATPCRHFAAAFAATVPNGEIYVLDPANYGSLIITGPVSIEGHGWAAVSPPGISSAAITINANPGDKINIIGVVLDGAALAGTHGIQFNSGGSLTVHDCVVRNFGLEGIFFEPNSSTPSQLFVSNALVSDNGDSGIFISPAGSGTTTGVFDRVVMEDNANLGLLAETETQTINVTVSDSVSGNNGNAGIGVNSGGGTPVSIMVRNSTIANNVHTGLIAFGSVNATILVTRSTITGSATAWNAFADGVVTSYGDNNIDGNGFANTEPPNPLTYK